MFDEILKGPSSVCFSLITTCFACSGHLCVYESEHVQVFMLKIAAQYIVYNYTLLCTVGEKVVKKDIYFIVCSLYLI